MQIVYIRLKTKTQKHNWKHDKFYNDLNVLELISSRKSSRETNGESAFENCDNLDEIIDLSLPPLSSMISTNSSVLPASAVSSQLMVNNFVTGASAQCSSIPQVM